MRPRQPLSFVGCGVPVLPVLEVNENGLGHFKYVDQSKLELPAVETTDLRACLDAGVPLKQVNTKIFNQSSIVTDLSVEEKKEQNSEEGAE